MLLSQAFLRFFDDDSNRDGSRWFGKCREEKEADSKILGSLQNAAKNNDNSLPVMIRLASPPRATHCASCAQAAQHTHRLPRQSSLL